ncbi:MAG: hypothetical protein KQH59_03975 [Desulfobulbaceae bacterium]|nr:hypothetical protein [Desulfobulbaceae bacterium]
MISLCRIFSILLVTLCTFLSLFSGQARAADENLVDPGQLTFREAIADTSDEHIDPYTGQLDLTYTDLYLPGDGGLDLRIMRTYKSSRVTNTAMVDGKLGYGWDISFGRVKQDGNFVTIELQDGTTSTAVRETYGSNYFNTKEFWKLYMPIGAFPVLQLTDGTTITFGEGSLQGFLATEIRKNNNTITISYDSDKINTVTYTAGGSSKTISFHYATSGRRHLQSITWGSPSRQITYGYAADDQAVTSVSLPGGDRWSYTYQQQAINLRSAYILRTINTPWGGTVTYGFDTFARGNGVLLKTQGSVASKQISGRGLVTGTWNYDYQEGSGYDETTINDPCGRTTTYQFYGYGSSYGSGECYKYGLTTSKAVRHGTSHEITTAYTWNKLTSPISPIAYSIPILCSDPSGTFVPVQTAETITRGGKQYSTSYSNFDAYGSAGTIVEQGSNTRTTTVTYWHDASRNIVTDKPLTMTVTGSSAFPGTFTSTFSYYTNASADANYYGELKTAAPNGVTTTYHYDTRGNISSISDANNHTTSYQWSHGTVSRITNPVYNIQRTINWDGTVASETNGRGQTTDYAYDAAMRLTEIDPPLGNSTTTTYEYDGNGALTSVKEQRGSFFTRTTHDGLGRETGTTNSLNIQTTTTYSACGLKTETSSNIGDTTTYDVFGRPIAVEHRDGTSIVSTYLDDLHLRSTDEGGFASHRYFSAFGPPDSVLLTKTVDAGSQHTDYSYNILGSLTRASGLGRTDSYTYNSKNFLTAETHPECGTTTYTRDSVGNLKTIRDSLGTRTYTYDGIDRLVSVVSGSDSHIYSYDHADNRTGAISPDCTVTASYDAANRLTKTITTIDGTSAVLGYGYDGNDNLTSLTYPDDLTITYSYNTLNQITGITGFGGNLHGIAYFTTGPELGLLRQYTRSNNQQVAFTYDSRRRPYRSTYPATDQGYRFDSRGNLTTLYDYKDRSRDKSFGYDQLSRLTSFNGLWGTGSYQYTTSGNRLQKRIGSATTTYSYSNHLLSGSGYAFNGDGDMTRNGPLSFGYDRFHSLVTVTQDGEPSVTYGYDGDRQRVSKTVGDRVTLSIHDPDGTVLSELSEDGRVLENYIYLGDTLVARRSTNRPGDLLRDGRIELTDAMVGLQLVAGRPVSVPFTREGDIGGDGRLGLTESVHDLRVVAGQLPNESYELFWYDTDYLGSPMTLSDETGDVLWQTDTLPFGEVYEETGLGALNKRRYLGKELDPETGLLYFGARYLDSPVGRFLSADPVGLVDPLTGAVTLEILGNPQRLNRYAYGLNNPYRYVDPNGEWAEAVFIEGPSIAVGGHSFVSNVRQGNVGSAIVDVVGVVADIAAAIAPGIPGGVGLGIKASRGAKKANDFFEGTSYTGKVRRQMKQGDFHAFPESVKAFQNQGKLSKITGGDGITRQKLEIPGIYRGNKGNFEFIKESNGKINHRLFKPQKMKKKD